MFSSHNKLAPAGLINPENNEQAKCCRFLPGACTAAPPVRAMRGNGTDTCAVGAVPCRTESVHHQTGVWSATDDTMVLVREKARSRAGQVEGRRNMAC